MDTDLYRRPRPKSLNDLPLFAPPAPEEVREIHEDMESRAASVMAEWRTYLRGRALALLTPVSTDDLWAAMERGTVSPIPDGSHPNVLGSVFSGDPAGWRRVGFERSTRAGAGGNLLT